MDNRRRAHARGLGKRRALVALAASLGCRAAAPPTLVLQFEGLPVDATAVSVELSSDSWRFAAADVEGGPVTIHHPDGRLRLDLDRAYLAGRGDRLRLGLAVPERVEVTAVALATAGGRPLRAAALAAVVPGQDLVLSFAFVEAPPAIDAGSGAAADSAPPEEAAGAGPDTAQAPDTAHAPDMAGAADTASAPDAAEPTCMLGPLRPASVSAPSDDPTLAYAGGLFAVGWAQAGGSRILYNTLDPAGTLQRPSEDVTVVAPAGAATYRTPRLSAVGSRLALAYARRESPGGAATVVVRLLAPPTGATVAGPTAAGAATDTMPDEVAAAAVDEGGARIAVASRKAGMGVTSARVDLFDGQAAPLVGATVALPAARAVGLGWAPGAGRFAAATIADSSTGGGVLSSFVPAAGPLRSVPFTGAGDAPAVSAAGDTVAVAGAGDQVAVAWIDGQGCTGCSSREVWLALVDVGTGRVLATTRASAGADRRKSFPHLRWDGRSFVVVWAEYESPTSSTVRLRRFDRQLAPRGGALDLGVGAPTRPVGDVDLAVVGPNDYGVVMTLFTDRHHLRRLVCTGP